ncbi:TPA: NACHT domain-containing protein [Burkholderia multivorans]|nr:NACHT domain-containing protein [Burkholderia multivorans]
MSEQESLWQDIVDFADPFTEQKIKRVQGRSRISLIRNGRDVVYEMHPETGAITAKHREKTYPNMRSLLASDEFANIAKFAETQRRLFDRQASVLAMPSNIELDGVVATSAELADSIRGNGEKTVLVLLDGPAGVGKTFQIEQLARGQAAKCVRGDVVPPVLHISSRGRRLSNLRDVLAATTQEMGAAFGARQVPILVRHGLLVAAIDGFDELVDADGYEDAWGALKEFIDDVGTGGAIILAARDTFVEEQELLRRIERADGGVLLRMGHIQPISPAEATQWLVKAANWKAADIEADITTDILHEGSYALRPFFLRSLGEAGGWVNVLDTGPRTFLAESLVRRESRLIAQQLGGITATEIEPALTSLFQEIALEMAARETDSIEVDHLAFLTQYCFEGILDEKDIRKLSHKAGSFALLEPTLTRDRRKFAHTELQYYFLGGALLKSLASRSVPMVLRRSAVVGEHLEVFAEVFANNENRARKAAEFLSVVVGSDISADSLATNGGAILILAFSLGLIERLDYLTVIDAIFAGDSPAGVFAESNASRLDVSDANISQVEFINVNVGTLVVSPSTTFGTSIPALDVLEIRSKNGAVIERERERIQNFIAARTFSDRLSAYSNSPSSILLERVARRAMRYFYLRQHGDDDEGSILLKDVHWPNVKLVLERHGRIEVKKGRPMHGRPSPLLRIVNPAALLDYQNKDTQRIFDDLIEIEGRPPAGKG